MIERYAVTSAMSDDTDGSPSAVVIVEDGIVTRWENMDGEPLPARFQITGERFKAMVEHHRMQRFRQIDEDGNPVDGGTFDEEEDDEDEPDDEEAEDEEFEKRLALARQRRGGGMRKELAEGQICKIDPDKRMV